MGNQALAEMGAFSPFHWLVGLIGLLIFIWPSVRILHKAGYSGWWLLIAFIPLGNVIMLWVFAYADWPALRGAARVR